MDCIRCKSNPAAVSCSCLALGRHSDTSVDFGAGSKTVRTMEFAIGTTEAGLCEPCLKRIAFREPKAMYPKLYRLFYLIWGALSAAAFILLIVIACSKSKSDAMSVLFAAAMYSMLILLFSLGLFELILRLVAANRRSPRDRRLIARARKYPCKGIYSDRLYVPLDRDLYPDYAAFRAVNSEVMDENAKKIYESIVAPGSKVSFGDELKGLF